MEYKKLGDTNIMVSQICLGTMTWGRQNSETEAHEQINFALEKGINFLDTAEMYAVPANEESYGLTEKYIGTWIAKNKSKRQDVIIATKVTGPSQNLSYISKLPLGFSKVRIEEALDKSLNNLQTDYLDLYQLHWPERKSNMFGQRNYVHNAEWEDNFLEIINLLSQKQKEGKIRHFGLSNETPWGVMNSFKHSDYNQLPRFKTIQNAYNLLNRTFEHNLSEISHRENFPLLAYSPLAMGHLTGKYLNKTARPQARLNWYPYPRYKSSNVGRAVEAYQKLAKEFNLSLTQMSLAFVQFQEFVCSTIIGATTIAQLEENIASAYVDLNTELIDQINALNELIPNPAP